MLSCFIGRLKTNVHCLCASNPNLLVNHMTDSLYPFRLLHCVLLLSFFFNVQVLGLFHACLQGHHLEDSIAEVQ